MNDINKNISPQFRVPDDTKKYIIKILEHPNLGEIGEGIFWKSNGVSLSTSYRLCCERVFQDSKLGKHEINDK